MNTVTKQQLVETCYFRCTPRYPSGPAILKLQYCHTLRRSRRAEIFRTHMTFNVKKSLELDKVHWNLAESSADIFPRIPLDNLVHVFFKSENKSINNMLKNY